jgi:hypothetical protein
MPRFRVDGHRNRKCFLEAMTPDDSAVGSRRVNRILCEPRPNA